MAASSLTKVEIDAIQDLARELGLELDDTYNEHDWDELWRFDKERYTREQATTDYAKLHPVIQYQFERNRLRQML